MLKVLFLSTHNACRSHMAEAIVNHHYKGKIQAHSAGVEPSPIHPLTQKVMKEIGLDVSQHITNKPEDFKNEQFDYIVTLCDEAMEACPVFWTTGEAIYKHISVEDPFLRDENVEDALARCRESRDFLEERLLNFFDTEISAPQPAA